MIIKLVNSTGKYILKIYNLWAASAVLGVPALTISTAQT